MTLKETALPLRIDLYIRVSGQEQAIKGLSLKARQEDLEEYAKECGRVIVGTYVGSGAKLPGKISTKILLCFLGLSCKISIMPCL